MTIEPFELRFNDKGELQQYGDEGWREPVCAVCGEPIRWCLDMFSFTTGFPHRLAHARCVWLTGAFQRLTGPGGADPKETDQ